MTCPSCGPSPEDVIWDGISLGFQKKFMRTSLRPPTVLHRDSIQRDKARYIPRQQALVDAVLRRSLRKVLQGPGAVDDDFLEDDTLLEETIDGSPEALAQDRAAVQAAALLAHIALVDSVGTDLSNVCPHLGELFSKHFSVTPGHRRLTVFTQLFAHVRS